MWRPFVPFTPSPLFDAHDSITQPCWYQSILISPNYHGLNTLAVPANSRSIECWVKCGSCILAFTWHMFAFIRFTCVTFFHHCHYVANNRTGVCVCAVVNGRLTFCNTRVVVWGVIYLVQIVSKSGNDSGKCFWAFIRGLHCCVWFLKTNACFFPEDQDRLTGTVDW